MQTSLYLHILFLKREYKTFEINESDVQYKIADFKT